MSQRRDITDLVFEMKSRGEAFVVATVVRTVSVTAAKPGAKAIIDGNGDIIEGWIGGGCARHAVIKAAIKSIKDGQSRLVSLKPEELIDELECAGLDEDAVIVARNLCPSQGSMDIFVEPMLSNPSLLILGSSPVAEALMQLASQFDLNVAVMGMKFLRGSPSRVSALTYERASEIPREHPHRYIVVATQGSGDLTSLELALSLEAHHVAFVGSMRKMKHLQAKLATQGIAKSVGDRIDCPAGIDIGALTPQEIALSILANIIRIRRHRT